MDSLRGRFSDREFGEEPEYDSGEDDAGHEPPPSPVGQDERRMQVRAYNHWASLLGRRSFPSIEDLEPENLPDFSPYSVLLDFTSGVEDPGIPFLGEKLAEECLGDGAIDRLSDVPSRSLLSRITDHYMQILANQAPIGFEAEFVNIRGATILYRGILLPFSSDDDTIDFIYGVINWKELADQKTSDALLLEIDQALSVAAEPAIDEAPLTAWADGPADGVLDLAAPLDLSKPLDLGEPLDLTDPLEPADPLELSDALEFVDPQDPVLDGTFDVGFDAGREADPIEWPAPEFGARFDHLNDAEADDEPDEAQPLFGANGILAKKDRSGSGLLSGAVLGHRGTKSDEPKEAEAEDELGHEFGHDDFGHHGLEDSYAGQDAGDHAVTGLDYAGYDNAGLDDAIAGDFDPDMGLADWLASARELAQVAKGNEDRSRQALYAAIGRAYDFSLAAQAEPAELEALVSDAGLTMQDRAPMTPLVKLVFGADYDKTRLTEYASALSHGHRLGIGQGALADFLSAAPGGLKGVVQAERKLKRDESGKPAKASEAPRDTLARKLRKLDHRPLAAVEAEGQEFTLLVARRLATGEVVLLGEVSDDVPMLERAARRLLG